tara:strand:+ start:380 stop:850 length:471 start_codon:yes stop_codon:yes gene_type:complete
MVEYIINAPDTSKNKPKGTRYFINVGSVMYTLFACLSRENIAFGVRRSMRLKIKANTPIIIKYSVDSLINEYIINIAAIKRPNPNGTRYCINVGSVIYILFALRSMDSIVFGAASSRIPNRTEILPMLSMYIILSPNQLKLNIVIKLVFLFDKIHN